MTLQASLGSQCPGIYNLNYLQAGLIFLPPGVAGTVAAKLQGVLIDRHYKRMCKQLDDGAGAEFQRGEDISDFPIEKARLRGATVMVVITVAGTVGYGVALMTRAVSYPHLHAAKGSWLMNTAAHLGNADHAVRYELHHEQHLLSESATGTVWCKTNRGQMTNTLLTDLNPTRAATVRGASNLVRCLLAGGCIAALEPVTGKVGLGWCFGVYAVLQALAVQLIWGLEIKGLAWREEHSTRQAQ
jgi:hypothetical protein